MTERFIVVVLIVDSIILIYAGYGFAPRVGNPFSGISLLDLPLWVIFMFGGVVSAIGGAGMIWRLYNRGRVRSDKLP